MKIYIVTKTSQCYYDLSVIQTKHGAFLNFDSATKRLKEVIQDFKTKNADNITKYSNTTRYSIDEGDLYREYSDEWGWECSFGHQERHESHQICIDEYDVEDA